MKLRRSVYEMPPFPSWLKQHIESNYLSLFSSRCWVYKFIVVEDIYHCVSIGTRFSVVCNFGLKHKANTCSQSLTKLACKVLNDHAIATVGFEATSEELSELAIKVSNDFNQIVPIETLTMSSLSELAASISRKQECFHWLYRRFCSSLIVVFSRFM